MNKQNISESLASFSTGWQRPDLPAQEIGALLKLGLIESRRPRRYLSHSALFRLTDKGMRLSRVERERAQA